MRAQFEVERSCYPIAALPKGEGRYEITNMVGLDSLCDTLLPYEVANTIATRANALHRASRQHGWTEHGVSPEVQAWVKAEAAAYSRAMAG